ncbi:hypothetical protein PG993_010984 [Apiospora rasikravindrae]|uniref:Uncharacterized protein n=1 Tax=Apiospora rasikravindrae TaxID=990691 RepID=A0ABR1SCY4_9PEZI
MDSTIEQILAVSDRSFLHGVLRDLCKDNGFVRQAVLERFTTLPDGPGSNITDTGNAAGGDQLHLPRPAYNLPAHVPFGLLTGLIEGCYKPRPKQCRQLRNPKRRQARGFPRFRAISLRHPACSFRFRRPTGSSCLPHAGSPEVHDLTNSSDVMVIDDDDDPNDSGSEFHDGDADTPYHSGGDESDSDLFVSSDEEQPRPSRRRLPPTIFNVQEYARPENFAHFPENKTRLNLYRAIFDHITHSENIDRLTERLIDCKDPAYIRHAGARLHRMELNRRACRDAIENVLDAEDRVNEAEYDRAMALAAAASGQYEARTGAAETMDHWLARVDRERKQQVERRVAEVREEADRTYRMNTLHVAAKQAAVKGAKWLRKSFAKEARERREWFAKKRKEEAEAKKAAREARRRGRRNQSAISNTPSEVGSMMGNASA